MERLAALAGGDDGNWRAASPTPATGRAAAEARARAAAVHDEVVALVGEGEALVAPEARSTRASARGRRSQGEWQAMTAPLAIDAALASRVRRRRRVRGRRRAVTPRRRRSASSGWRPGRSWHARGDAVRGGRRADARRRSGCPRAEGRARAAGRRRRLAGERPRPGCPRRSRSRCGRRWPPRSTRLRELRDADEWRRWANAGIQEELCKRSRSAEEVNDLAERRPPAARSAAAVEGRQRRAADEADALWHALQERRRRRSGALPTRTSPRRRGAGREPRQASIALCDQAEALAQSTDWVATAETLKKLQADWQTIGAGPRGTGRPSWRAASAPPATRSSRAARRISPQRKDEWSDEPEEEGRAVRAGEQLAESTDWTNTLTRSRSCRATGRRSVPCAATSRKRSGSGSAAPATSSSNATASATRSISARSLEEREEVCRALEAVRRRKRKRRRLPDEHGRRGRRAVGALAQAPGVPSQTLVPSLRPASTPR